MPSSSADSVKQICALVGTNKMVKFGSFSVFHLLFLNALTLATLHLGGWH